MSEISAAPAQDPRSFHANKHRSVSSQKPSLVPHPQCARRSIAYPMGRPAQRPFEMARYATAARATQTQGRPEPAQTAKRPAQHLRKTRAKPVRQVVQIAIAAVADDESRAQYFVALCSDGTLWRFLPSGFDGARAWARVPLPSGCEVRP